MFNVVLECLRFAYTFLEVLLNYISKPSHLINTLLHRDGDSNQYIGGASGGQESVHTIRGTALFQEALSKLLIHSSRAGIRRVTLYDPWSYISSKQEILRHLTQNLMLKSCSKNCSIVFCEAEDNSFPTGPQCTTVKILSGNDGRQSLVRACRKLCRSHEPAEITLERVSKCLAQEHIYEPDFLLRIGDLETLAGYPAWALRVTEILSLRNLASNFSYRQFLSYLHDYSSRDRRFGR
ncbi:unnamed protein product [Gongylonema pulchrum]|uniref:ditrans,polycis-polyprenyl diphosphate synthase [(2E,6E)-farnesyldiphosphate specific] n=1 Tax=Gongylonema pulchrum TaxID=637853 RepID=A0A183DRC5_9BILA|nr:unnamed protein product [Gongylonema pulchrum]